MAILAPPQQGRHHQPCVDPLTTSDICEHQEEVSASPGPGSHVRGAAVRWADWPEDLSSPFTAGVLHVGGGHTTLYLIQRNIQ